MTGDDCLRVLDLDMELGEHAAGIMQEHGRAWLKGRLMYYGEKSDALFRAAGEVLAEVPDRAVARQRSERDSNTLLTIFPKCAELSLSCLLYTSPSPRDGLLSRMPSSA